MEACFMESDGLQETSFSLNHYSQPHFLKLWHYHHELELVYIQRSTGIKFVGDGMESFNEGEVVLIGENLPHMWLNDSKYFERSDGLIAESYTVHFKKHFLGKEFLNATEMGHISNLLETAIRGIKFINLEERVKLKIQQLWRTTSIKRLCLFLDVLNDLALHKEKSFLVSQGNVLTFNRASSKKMAKSYEYIFKNFNRSIQLGEAARICNMNPSAFSRSFKKINGKTFRRYLNEIRVGYACKLINESNYSITRICYESGYNNISNFNRQFKEIMGQSPSSYGKHCPKAHF